MILIGAENEKNITKKLINQSNNPKKNNRYRRKTKPKAIILSNDKIKPIHWQRFRTDAHSSSPGSKNNWLIRPKSAD